MDDDPAVRPGLGDIDLRPIGEPAAMPEDHVARAELRRDGAVTGRRQLDGAAHRLEVHALAGHHVQNVDDLEDFRVLEPSWVSWRPG